MVKEIFECLFLTIIFECACAYIMGIRKKDDLYLVILVNCITNPLLVLFSSILMNIVGPSTGILLTYLILEPIVMISEYLLYKDRLEISYNLWIVVIILNIVSIVGGNLWRSLL